MEIFECKFFLGYMNITSGKGLLESNGVAGRQTLQVYWLNLSLIGLFSRDP
jgi:hypothetical protein